MSKQANKTLIGGFVIGAVALLVAVILILGSGTFFTERDSYVLYFEGSVKGLNIGAPVVFRGVKVGSVTDISLMADPEELTVRIPVIIEVEPDKFKKTVQKQGRDPEKTIQLLIEKGLRAQLVMQSFVTGQLMVNLDFNPEKPARFSGLKSEHPEIPTIASGLEELVTKIEELPLSELINRANSSLEGLEDLVKSPELKKSISALHGALKDIRILVQDMHVNVAPLLAGIENSSNAARVAFEQAEKTFSSIDGATAELTPSAQEALNSATSAMKHAEETLVSIQSFFAKDSQLMYELNNTLRELTATSRSIRIFVEYIEEHPEAFLKGKSSHKGE
jgi:paraquat-inducible protein B